MNGEDEPAATAPKEEKVEPDGPLGQDDIDALLAEMNGEDEPAAAAPKRRKV